MRRFFVALVLLPLMALAETETVDGITWTYSIIDGKAQIGAGSYSSAIPTKTTGEIKIPSALGGFPVTSIGIHSFYGCSGLTSVAIPDGVRSIGRYAFENCGLMSVLIPTSVTNIAYFAFNNCAALTTVTIPEGVTSIEGYAFRNCKALSAVKIPSSLSSIGESAFYGCSGLTEVHISDLSAWCNVEFEDFDANPLCYAMKCYVNENEVADLQIPEGVTNINDYAFYNCKGLTSVFVPPSVMSIGRSAFSGCDGLTRVRISDLSAWCNMRFKDGAANPLSYAQKLYLKDNEILELQIPDGVRSINDNAFRCCKNLMSVTIPSSVTNIGHSAFSGCSGLTSVTIHEGVANIGGYAFCDCNSLSFVKIPTSVIRIGLYVFLDCWNLENIEMPLCVESVRDCFCNDPTFAVPLSNVVFTAPGTTISSNLLAGCTSVKTVRIPSSVTKIDRGAFVDTGLWTEAEDGLIIVDDCLIDYKGKPPSEFSIPSFVRLVADGFLDGFDFYNKLGKVEKMAENLAGKSFRLALGFPVYCEEYEGIDAAEQRVFEEATGAPAAVTYAGCDGRPWQKFDWDVVTFDYGTARGGPGCSVVDEDGNYMDWYNISSCCWYENPSVTNITPKALRSAPVTEESTESVMSVTVNGAGRLSFVWGLSKGNEISPIAESYIVNEDEYTGRYHDRDYYYYSYEYIGSLTCYLDGEECAYTGGRDRGEICTVEISGEGEHLIQWVFEFNPPDVWDCCSTQDDPFGFVGGVRWAGDGEALPERKIDLVMLSTTQFMPYQEYRCVSSEWYSGWIWGASDESIRAYGYLGEAYHYDNRLSDYWGYGYRPEAYVFVEGGLPIGSASYEEELCGDNVLQLSAYDKPRITPGTTTVTIRAGDENLTGTMSAEYSVAYGGDTFDTYSYNMDVRIVSNTGEEKWIYGSWGESHEVQFDYNGENALFDLYNEMSPWGSSDPDRYCYTVWKNFQYEYDEWGNPICDERVEGCFWFYDYNWQRAEPLSFKDAGVYVIEFPEYRHRERWYESPYLTEEFEQIRNSDTYTITINPKEVTEEDFELSPSEVVFDGMAHCIEVTCKGFPEFTGEVIGSVVSNAGDYVIYVTATGNFSGTVELPIRVFPKAITNLTTTLDISEAKYYTGSSNMVAISVQSGETDLIEGVDYVVKYYDNVNPGAATVNVIGTNNYSGMITRQWTILARETAEIVGGWSEPQTFEYDGLAHGVDYSARLDVMDWPLNVVTQGTIRAVSVGEYAATARVETVGVPETDAVYYRCAAVTNECRWTITPKPVTKLQITYVSTAMIANGRLQTPQIVVRDMERGVVLTTADYTLAYENNVEPGMGIARITGKGNYGGETRIEFPIVAGVSPSEGLNMDGGVFEIVGETDWVADNVVTHDGYASMRSGTIGSNEVSALTAVVHGAGTVSFWWKVSSQRFDSVLELDRLEFYIDGERQQWINGDTPWTNVSYKVDGAGPHELKWVYAKDGSISEGQDCGWVDEVTWEKEWLIGDWLNDVDREFTTGEGGSLVKWTPDSSVSADGVGSMRSGACQQGQRSVLSTVVENAGELTFKWKSSCVAYGSYVTDKLSLLVDGVPVKDKDGKDVFINGQTDWLDVSYRISGVGRHEVSWVFEKVSDASMGQNCGWVDVVRWNGEPGTLTDADLVVEAFDGIYDGQGHGVEVSVTGAQSATVKYGTSSEAIVNAASPTFADCGEHEVWFAVNVPEFNEYVGKTVVRIKPRSIETGVVTLGKSLVYARSVQTQTVSSVIVDGLAATFEVADNEARDAGAYRLTVTGIGNFCGTLSVPFAVAKAQASVKDVVVEGASSETGVVEFAYDGKPHLPTVVAGYDGSAAVRFSLSEEGPYADELDISNVVERMDVWYEIDSVNYARLVGRIQMTIHPLSIEKAVVVLGEQVSDVEGRVVQLVDSVIVDGLSAAFDVADNVAAVEGDFELTVTGTGNFTGKAKCPYSVGGIVLPPLMTPGDGTVFTNALTVYISAQTPDSKCYYTLDGSMPTTNSLTARRVNLHGKTTIRAMAVLDGKLRSAVAEARYALGACENPKIRLEGLDGEVFHFPGQQVVIDWDGEEGVVRYTLDGSEPTTESLTYKGPFAISQTTTVKAKAFSDTCFDSETVTAAMRLEVLSVPTPVIRAASEYCGTRTTVSLSCTLDGAAVRYTLDGSEPTAMSALYEGEFEIGGELGSSIPVKARAFCDGYADSPVAEAVVTRVWGIGDTLGVPDMAFMTDGWVVDAQETLDGCASMRSGPTGDGETKTLETVVQGGGSISFSWRTSCEDSDGDFIWDRAEFWVDDVCIAKLEGERDWLSVVHEITDDKDEHRLRWLYVKDPEPETFEGADCAWLNGVSWLSSGVGSVRPSVEGDEGATVTGDAEKGFVVRPSEGMSVVAVTIPLGVDAAKVTVEVSPKVVSVKPNGAKVKIVSGGANITEHLDIPGTISSDGGGTVTMEKDGVVDLAKATVKDAVVKAALDTEKGAVIELNAASPSITTAPTKVGLKYTFREGSALEGLGAKLPSATKIGDGQPWSPKITVKGGNSAFYSIWVEKGE